MAEYKSEFAVPLLSLGKESRTMVASSGIVIEKQNPCTERIKHSSGNESIRPVRTYDKPPRATTPASMVLRL